MNADSVKARLKNFAVSSGCTFQDALVYYGLERTIYRISVSPYAGHFVLKGGIFLYAIFDRKYERAMTDVDLLARRISNSAEEMKTVFRDIFAQDTDDALVFALDSITAEDITEFKEYHGLHISAVAYLDRTRWNSFLKKKRALIPVSMNDAISRIRTFVTPLLTQPSVPVTEWDPNEGCWK
jgi:hypothetical protein